MKKTQLIGLVAGLLATLPYLLFYYTDLLGGLTLNRLTPIAIGIIALSIPLSVYLMKREHENGKFFFADAFKFGMQTTAIAALVIVAFTFAYYRFIDLETPQAMIKSAVEEAKAQGIGQEKLDEMVIGAKQFFSPFTQATSTLLFTLFGGAFVSLFSALAFARFPR